MFTYDLTQPSGFVRLLIGDTNTIDPSKQIYADAEIAAFLTICNQNALRAAAMSLRAIASNEVQVLKVIKSLDIETNGEAVADVLQKLAVGYEERAEFEATPASGFAIAEMVETSEQFFEKLVKETLRSLA